MGCFQSKKEISDQHPNFFRVINIDENGADLCSGQLEVTESEIVLYREGRTPVLWPLHCLRRFGFDGELFSFEAGRRCETGEGIYGFKCRRASLLFRILHQRIYQRNIDRDTIPRLSSPTLGRQTLQASVIHRSSVDNGQPSNVTAHLNSNPDSAHIDRVAPAPHSPSSTDILEVMPLYPRPQASGSHVTNIYQLRDFKREHNNNQSEIGAGSSASHSYTNDLSRDLAELRKTLRQETALNAIRDIEEEQKFIASLKEEVVTAVVTDPISPTLSTVSERYAQLNMEHGDPRLYMNVVCSASSPVEGKQNDSAPPTPLTPKQVEYCNLTVAAKSETNSYANMMMSDLSDKIRNSKQALSEHNQKFSESDTFTSMSPVEEMEVNYAVLDIDSNNEAGKSSKELGSPDNQSIGSNDNSIGSSSTQTRNVGVSSSSYDIDQTNTSQSAAIGYTSIDFAATSALSSVVTKTEIFLSEAGRKHRHNSCTVSCGSPGSSDKSRGNN